jgi:hypothetical protein
MKGSLIFKPLEEGLEFRRDLSAILRKEELDHFEIIDPLVFTQ